MKDSEGQPPRHKGTKKEGELATKERKEHKGGNGF
jgi:hypothetical protein